MIKHMNKEKVRDIIAICFISLLAIILQIIFLNPPVLSDQMEYYFWALRFPHWPKTPNLEITRLGLVLPVAVLYRIFGSAEITYYSFQVISLSLLAASIYLIAQRFFSFRTGIISACWFLLIPNLLLESGHLLPDIPAAALFTAGCALIVITNHSKGIHPKPVLWHLFLAGMLFGWSYLVKETTAILFPLIPLLIWSIGNPIRRMAPIAAGMLFMLILELVIGFVFFNNPLFHFMAASPRETIGTIQENVWINLIYLLTLLRRTGGFSSLALPILGTIGAVIYSIKREKVFIFLLTWVLLVYAVFSMVGLLPVILGWEDKALLRLHKFRYWIPILPPLVISSATFLDRLACVLTKKFINSGKLREFFAWFILFALMMLSITSGILVINKDPDLIRNGNDHYFELRKYLISNEQDITTIWIDRDNHRAFERILPIYTHDFFGRPIWNGRIKYINTSGQYLRAEEIEDGYVIADNFFMDPSYSGTPAYMTQPPKNWKLAFQSENGQIALYQVE